MRAVRVHAYGGPETMRVEEVPMPTPGAGERLVSLAAASVNPIDWKMRQGRLRAVFSLELPRVLGISVVAGEPIPIDALRGGTPSVPGASALPVPVTPEKC